MGNIESIQVAYDRTKSYIVYDSFQYITIAIVVFLIGMKLWDVWQKNLSSNNHRFDVAAYWGQVKICLVVCFIATSAGMVFHLVETVCVELQDNLINDLGGDTGNKSIETMTNMVKNQVLAVQEKESKGLTLDIPNITDIVWKALTAIVMSVGVFLFKYTYTFFILGRYMWLLLLELIAPVAIVLMIHENTRSYFYTWLKNMIICYLMIPMFLLADKFSNEVAGFFMEGKEDMGQVTVLVIVCVGVWVKIKMFSVVKAKASNLF